MWWLENVKITFVVCLLFLLGMGIEGKEKKKDDELPFLANIYFFNLSYYQLYIFSD